MKWTEQKVYKHIEKHNGPEIVKLVKTFLETLKDGEFFKFGKGDKFPSIKIFVNNLSEDQQIIGIEFFKLGAKLSEPGFQYWINLKDHEESNKILISKLREYLGEYKKICPTIEPVSPSNLPHEVRTILQIINDHFHLISHNSFSKEGAPIPTRLYGDYIPSKDDFESAYRMICSPGHNIAIESVLDQIEKNAINLGHILRRNWRMITERNIKIWLKKD